MSRALNRAEQQHSSSRRGGGGASLQILVIARYQSRWHTPRACTMIPQRSFESCVCLRHVTASQLFRHKVTPSALGCQAEMARAAAANHIFQSIAYRTCSADACPEALVHRSERRPIRARWCVNDPCLVVCRRLGGVGKSLSGRTQSNKCVMW